MATDGKLLFHLSDIHFGLVDDRAIAWVKREIAEQRPDAVAITGDLTMRARHREFAAATQWIQSLDVPVTVEVGNHDMPYFNLIERFFTPYKRFRGMAEHVEQEIDLPGLAIVPLKTAVRAQPRFNWSKGWVTEAALRKCLAAIDALPPGARALVAVHHPLREVGTQGTALTMNGGKALRALASRPVEAVISGHVHDAFDIMEQTDNGPVRMIADKLKPGGEFRFGTDHPIYLRHALMVMRRFTDEFEWQVEGRDSWENRPSGWCQTRYEKKAREQMGHEVWYFRFRRR